MSDDEEDSLNKDGRMRGTPEAWLSDADLDRLTGNVALERQVHPEETDAALCKRLFREASPTAVSMLIHIAMHGGTERLRLEASKHIIDRVLGPANAAQNEGTGGPLESFIDEITEFANAGGGESEGSQG